jgi:hypothetical protein
LNLKIQKKNGFGFGFWIFDWIFDLGLDFFWVWIFGFFWVWIFGFFGGFGFLIQIKSKFGHDDGKLVKVKDLRYKIRFSI